MECESSLFDEGHDLSSDTPQANTSTAPSSGRNQSLDPYLFRTGQAREVMVSLKIEPEDTELLRKVKSHGAYWDSRRSAWRLSQRVALKLGLEKNLL